MESHLTAGNLIRRYRSVRCLGKALGEFMPQLGLGHIRNGLGTKRDVDVNFLVRQGIKVVLLVTVQAICGMRHAVLGDTRCKPGLILDGAEMHPMGLCPGSLSLCVGSGKCFDFLKDICVLRWKQSSSGVKMVNTKKRKRREEGNAQDGGASK